MAEYLAVDVVGEGFGGTVRVAGLGAMLSNIGDKARAAFGQFDFDADVLAQYGFERYDGVTSDLASAVLTQNKIYDRLKASGRCLGYAI
ncbi:hypothetical protein PPUJ20005_51930 [Pseudomonas putida]|nr:hypothetical protein PPUJ20005_51930 [Pseudomonas putida]GLO25119.1 hypothetical protein PPUJ21368_29480 [Pseudomonas putida]